MKKNNHFSRIFEKKLSEKNIICSEFEGKKIIFSKNSITSIPPTHFYMSKSSKSELKKLINLAQISVEIVVQRNVL